MDFYEIVQNAIEADDLLSLVLSKPCANFAGEAEKRSVRPVVIRGERKYQWSARQEDQETHENLSPEETATQAGRLFPDVYAHGHVFTPEADYFARSSRKGRVKISTSPPSKNRPSNGQSHNRKKHYLLPENEPCPFLEAIGVMTPAGKVKASRYKKFRQINRYLEIVNDIVPDLPRDGLLKVVDFGCGKSYLTFALHHLLSVIHQRQVQIVGLDRKAAVIRDCRAIAERLDLRGLEFREGDLWSHDDDEIHLAVSLHACDTATDDALAKAASWRADVILAVPCCQKEIASLLSKDVFPAVQTHGILKDRLAAILTDSLRANALEALGYKTQVVEFIDMEHTAKNVLIRAIRRKASPEQIRQAKRDYREFQNDLGIETCHLDRALEQLNINHEPARAD